MKYGLFFTFIACRLVLSAQTDDYALGYGFNNQPSTFFTLADGRFLLTGFSEPVPGEPSTDTAFALVLNASGQPVFRLVLPGPAYGKHYVTDAVSTLDGGFVVSLASTACDVTGESKGLLGYDSLGNLRWAKWVDPNGPSLPAKLASGLGGILLGIGFSQITAYDYIDGDTLWTTHLSSQYIPYAIINDLDFLPGSQDFAAIGWPDFQIWKHVNIPGSHDYFLDYFDNPPGTHFFEKVLTDADGALTYDLINQRFFRFYKFDVPEYETLYHLTVSDWTRMPDGNILCLSQSADTTALIRINAVTTHPFDTMVSVRDSWRRGQFIALKDTKAVIAGFAGSGGVDTTTLSGYQGTHIWLHNLDIEQGPNQGYFPNAAVTAVEQQSSVQAELFALSSEPYIAYDLSGGNFRVQVTNTGQDTLREINVMAGFGQNEHYWTCRVLAAMCRHYDHFLLPPNESFWVDLGDIAVPGQAALPTQYCFWTAAPNGRPDADHSDDAFCHTISTETGEPAAGGQPRIFPNPAPAGELVVEWPTPLTETIDYQIFDALGRMVGRGRADAGTSLTQVSTRDWAPGFYFFQAGKWRGKVVVSKDF